jgi:PAS domain S-box-containing protein
VYTGCNKAFKNFIGLPASEIIGKMVYNISQKEIADEYFRKDEELLHNPGTQRYEWRVVSKDGQSRDVMFDKATIRNSEGEITGLIGTIFDITARMQV